MQITITLLQFDLVDHHIFETITTTQRMRVCKSEGLIRTRAKETSELKIGRLTLQCLLRTRNINVRQ